VEAAETRAARWKERCASAFAAGCLLALVEDVLSPDGVGWLALRATASAGCAFTLLGWCVVTYHDRESGTIRSWAAPVLMAAGVVVLALLVALLFG